LSLDDARQKLARFREHYNRERPHSALADRTPAAAALHREKASTLMGRETRINRGEKDVHCPEPPVSLVIENGSDPF